MTDVITSKPKPDRWQVLADMAYAIDGTRPGGADLDYIDRALRAFPMPADHMTVADFEGYAVHQLLTVLRDSLPPANLPQPAEPVRRLLTTRLHARRRDTSFRGTHRDVSIDTRPVPSPFEGGRRGTNVPTRPDASRLWRPASAASSRDANR